MNGIIFESQDPLISIIFFVSVVFVIALLTYLFNIYQARDDSTHLQNFTDQYDIYEKSVHLDALLKNRDVPLASLELLAITYFESANYEESIEVNIALLKRHKNGLKRRDTLLLLAKCYFKAGFYKRSEATLIELLRYHTREPIALRYLVVIYERLQRFDDALDLLESLDEMGENIAIEKQYFKLQNILTHKKMSTESKTKRALQLYRVELVRPIFTFLFRYNNEVAWEHLTEENVAPLMDMLWSVHEDKTNFEAVKRLPSLTALYAAKGYIGEESHEQTGMFAIDCINNTYSDYKENLDIQFEFICTSCKEITPLFSVRCPHCLSLLTLEVQSTPLVKGEEESYYSF